MDKFTRALDLIGNHFSGDILINHSPANGYRSRCEFGYKNGFYTMYDSHGKKIELRSFAIARPSIQNIMPKLIDCINNNLELNNKLFQINFRTNRNDHLLISLIYHKLLNDNLKQKASELADQLNIDINIRARKELFSTGSELLIDNISVNNSILYQTDQSFYQPNHFHMPKMIDKAIEYIDEPFDLLELYCGSGTFTLPLSSIFKNVFATESNRQSIKCITKSISDLKIKNIKHARLSAEEISEAFNGRIFRRMTSIDITDYNFSHILVDPPRSGLGEDVIPLLKKFKNIIYISCNYETYIKDLKMLSDYKIENIEIFDQFPNTPHLEIVSVIKNSF
jgi:tRNA (uracil-5-)-methyltransferase